MGETVVKTSVKTCLILYISIQPPSSSADHFILILIQIVTAGDNHIPTEEMERFQKIFDWGDGVNGADPLTIIYPITLSILVPSYNNGSIFWIVNKPVAKVSPHLLDRDCAWKKSRPPASIFCCRLSPLHSSYKQFFLHLLLIVPVFFLWDSLFWMNFLQLFVSLLSKA